MFLEAILKATSPSEIITFIINPRGKKWICETAFWIQMTSVIFHQKNYKGLAGIKGGMNRLRRLLVRLLRSYFRGYVLL